MSNWTHVRGSCLVEVFGYNDKDVDVYLNCVLNSVPKVTGSEGPVTLSYTKVNNNVKYMYNVQSSRNMTTVNPFYYVTFYGNLRDRLLNNTVYEVNDMLDSLSTFLCVNEYIDVLVYDDDGRYARCSDVKYYKKRFDTASASSFYFDVVDR